MFCPTINGECVGEACRDWNPKTGTCYGIEFRNKQSDAEEAFKEIAEMYKSVIESVKLSSLWTRLIINKILSDPTTSEEERKIIKKALQTPSSETAERLLEEEGLI